MFKSDGVEYERLVCATASRLMHLAPSHYEDLVSAGWLGVVTALPQVQDHPAPLAYIRQRIYGSMMDYVRIAVASVRVPRLAYKDGARCDCSSLHALAETADQPIDAFVHSSDDNECDLTASLDYLASLGFEESELYMLCCLSHGDTQADIARALGKSTGTISRDMSLLRCKAKAKAEQILEVLGA